MNTNELLEEIKNNTKSSVKKVYSTTGAAAISKATTVKTDYPGRKWKLKRLDVTFSTAPTTSQSFTVTKTPADAVNRPSTVLFSHNPSTDSATSILHLFAEGGVDMEAGDEVTMAFTNTDTRTVKAEVEVEVS